MKEAQSFLNAEDFLGAWQTYRKVLKKDPGNELAGVNAAFCSMKLSYPQDSIIPIADNLSASRLPDARYFLAKLRHKQKRFNEALDLLTEYRKTEPKKRLASDAEIDYIAGYCNNAIAFISKPHRSIIKNMGANINSSFDDYVPVIMPDESALYFTSKRKGSTGNDKNGDNTYYEDVYVSTKHKDNWDKAENAGFPLNTESNDACVAISSDGNRMIIYRTSAEDPSSGHLYVTHLNSHGHWETPKMMGSEINSEFIETSACFSNDTSEIYFSSNRPGGLGGKDIYRIRRLPDGRWAKPYNLGPQVNTKYDEDAPFLHPDGKTLFFSSKGHNSMGEYDVFKTELNVQSNEFLQAENLGYPINDVGNDIFFVLSVDGQRGYYSSNKKETMGGIDIYLVDTRFGDNDLVVKQGFTYFENEPGRVQITLFDSESNEMVGNYSSHPTSGKFILVINPMKSYKILIEEEGYETIEQNLMPYVSEKSEKVLRLILRKKSAK